MSDFTDRIIDGPEPQPRGTYWKSKFHEERERIQKKNKTITNLRAENTRLRAALEELQSEYLRQQNLDDARKVTYKWSLTRIQYALAGKEQEE